MCQYWSKMMQVEKFKNLHCLYTLQYKFPLPFVGKYVLALHTLKGHMVMIQTATC